MLQMQEASTSQNLQWYAFPSPSLMEKQEWKAAPGEPEKRFSKCTSPKSRKEA